VLPKIEWLPARPHRPRVGIVNLCRVFYEISRAPAVGGGGRMEYEVEAISGVWDRPQSIQIPMRFLGSFRSLASAKAAAARDLRKILEPAS
jgi:hypothetical protein